jgi:hypothetical protein
MRLLVLLALACACLCTCLCAGAQPEDAYARARAIVADLGRITAPSGVQETYKTAIGGVDQWLNVRGQDRANPMILFVHGGPASPVTPTMWQFQRPIEKYFTVANWDQRGAGKSYGETAPQDVAGTLHIARYVDDAIAERLSQQFRLLFQRSPVVARVHAGTGRRHRQGQPADPGPHPA